MRARRSFLAAGGMGVLGALSPPAGTAAHQAPPPRRAPVRPPRLRPGQTVALVSPASATFLRQDIDLATEVVEALGFRVRLAPHLADRYGYLAGRDAVRAADLNALFADPEVHGILALRGGWGSARLLPHLDFAKIAAHPKVLLGYSDITALLLPIHARTGLVTFHGPVGASAWTPFSVEHMKKVVVEAEAPTLVNPVEEGEGLVSREHRYRTLTPGLARGPLLGGNLTVLSHLLGSPYLPSWDGAILFLEDVDEEIYRVDRMLTHLRLAGVLERIAGFVFGACTSCEPGDGYGSLTLEEVFDDHVRPLGVPAYVGALVGHIDEQFTVPVGAPVEIDAARGSMRLLEPAVL